MPTVPNVTTLADQKSVMQQASPTNLLLAAAEMHRMGKFDQPEPKTAVKAPGRGKMKAV